MTAVGFRVAGQYPRLPRDAGETFLERCEQALAPLAGAYPFTFTLGHDLADRPTLFVGVHPAAEPMFITDCGDDDDRAAAGSAPAKTAGRFLAWANTAPVGPGYHVHVCEMFHDLVDRLALTLDPPGTMTDHGPTGDTTGYFYARDRAAVERAHLNALAVLCRRVLPICHADPLQQVTLSLKPDVYFDTDEPVQTLMGPRPLQWAVDVVAAADALAADPAGDLAPLRALARDVFPWYDPGMRAPYHLGRALFRMWCDVHWTTPKIEPDAAANFEAMDALEAAYAQDPTLDFPWIAWNMLINHAVDVGRPRPPYDEVIRERMQDQWRKAQAQTNRVPLLGYRWPDVRYRFADWLLYLPREYVHQPPFRLPPDQTLPEPEDLDEQDLAKTLAALTALAGFSAVHPDDKAVRLTTMALDVDYANGAAGVDRFLAAYGPPAGQIPIGRYDHDAHGVRGAAFLFRNPPGPPGTPAYTFSGVSVVPGQCAMTTVTYADREDRDEAERIWRSVTPVPMSHA